MERTSRTHRTPPIARIVLAASVAMLLPLAALTLAAQDAAPVDATPREPAKALADDLKAAGQASQDVAGAVKEAQEALRKASQVAADAKAAGEAIGKASDAVKAIGTAQERLGKALEGAAKLAANAAAPAPAAFPDPGYLPGCYLLGTTRVGFFAVPFAGAFDEKTVDAAGKQGRRAVGLGQTLGKQRVLNRVAMKDGDTSFANIAFGVQVQGDDSRPQFLAIGDGPAGLKVFSGGRGAFIEADPGTTQSASFQIENFGQVKLKATLRGGFAELFYTLPDDAELIQIVGKYEPLTVSAGAEPFQFHAVMLAGRDPSSPDGDKIEAAGDFAREVAAERGLSLARTRHGITFLPGDRLLLVASSSDHGTRARCLLTFETTGEITVLHRSGADRFAGVLAEPLAGRPRVGDFVRLELPGGISIPVKIDLRANYGLDFSVQWPR